VSELTKALAGPFQDACGFDCDTVFADVLRELLPAHDDANRDAAKRDQYQLDCAAICNFCDDGDPVTPNPWRHSMSDPCAAEFIHDAWEKAHPKDKI